MLTLALDTAEAETVAETNHASLADFDCCQVVTAGGKNIQISAPPKLRPVLRIAHSTPRLNSRRLRVAQLPDGSTSSVVRPNPDEALGPESEKPHRSVLQ